MDLDGGTGFDRGFLTEEVHPPGSDPADLLVVDGQVELRYMHFSVAMHAHRRLARWVAWNIDGLTRWDGDDIPRNGMRFVPDPRVPAGAQTTEAVYTGNRLDRGHLARRADLLWGTRAEAQVANRHSFYFTNITPQMDNFNQSGQNGIWGRLENAVLAATGSARVSVLAGPVLAADDPPYRGVQVPLVFWNRENGTGVRFLAPPWHRRPGGWHRRADGSGDTGAGRAGLTSCDAGAHDDGQGRGRR